MYFAAGGIHAVSISFSLERNCDFGRVDLVTGVKRVVEIHAGQHGEHVGLQERDQKLERVSPIVMSNGSTASASNAAWRRAA